MSLTTILLASAALLAVASLWLGYQLVLQNGRVLLRLDRLEQAAGMLLFGGGTSTRTASDPNVLSFGGTLATIVIDPKTATYRGLSPYVSNNSVSKGTLHAAALTNVTVHVLAESAERGMRYNTQTHSIVR